MNGRDWVDQVPAVLLYRMEVNEDGEVRIQIFTASHSGIIHCIADCVYIGQGHG
ncbi:hypothetical protein D3C76_1595950 [compost metagenome]